MTDSLRAILKRSEREPAILHADQVANWPAGDLEHWLARDVLQPISPARCLPCLGCGGEHREEIVFLTDPGTGSTRAYLPCSLCGPSEIAPAALRRWRVDLEGLFAAVFAGIVTPLRITALVPGRLWRVGKSRVPAGEFSVFAARQLHRRDSTETLARARISSRAVVLALAHWPVQTATIPGPLILPLTTLVAFTSGCVRFDREQVADRLAERPQDRGHIGKRPARKRASRAADIAALTKEMREHLRTARDYAFSNRNRTGQPQLLPRPTQEELARRIGASQWTVSRCLNDPEARELDFLWNLAVDLERLLAHGG